MENRKSRKHSAFRRRSQSLSPFSIPATCNSNTCSFFKGLEIPNMVSESSLKSPLNFNPSSVSGSWKQWAIKRFSVEESVSSRSFLMNKCNLVIGEEVQAAMMWQAVVSGTWIIWISFSCLQSLIADKNCALLATAGSWLLNESFSIREARKTLLRDLQHYGRVHETVNRIGPCRFRGTCQYSTPWGKGIPNS